jgi:dipeptidyl aminopeptidase/acylaminoacyl peptidase
VPIQIYARKIRDINQEAMYKNATTDKENSPITVLSLKIILFFFFFILPVVTCPSWGQVVQKKHLTSADYHLWGELQPDKIAPNGKWISYRMSYESGEDTLFVRNTESLKTYAFPAGSKTTFEGAVWFACQEKQELKLLNLKTGKLESIAGIAQYAFTANADKLVLLNKTATGESSLLIRKPEGAVIKKINGVHDFIISPTAQDLVYWATADNKNEVGLLSLGKKQEQSWLLRNQGENFDGFTWDKSGKAFAFYSHPTASTSINGIFYYSIDNKKVLFLDPKTQSDFPTNANITTNSTYKLSISDDLQKVFLGIKSNPTQEQAKHDSDVELWNGNARRIYPMQQINGKSKENPHLAVWYPTEHRFSSVSTAELPKVMLNGNQQYAIVSNPLDYEPQYEQEGPRDYYIVDLATGEKNLLLRKHSGFFADLLPSPGGKYIAYFKENNWWVYNIATKTHTNITQNTGGQFAGKVYVLDPESAYGNPAWSANDSEILIYDQYDVWAIKPNGTSFKKLTHGREHQIKYRLANILDDRGININYDGRISNRIDLDKDLFLRAEGNDGQTGYFKWKKDTGEKAIIYGQSYLDQFAYTANKQVFFYREQKFDLSPRLMCKDFFSAPKQIFRSNPQQSKYNWGKAELMEYQNSKKKILKGALFYPADYDPKKKYPMIVHIYEKQSQALHKYVNPTSLTEDGFNTTAFTTQGYFIFYPDIVHEKGDPGISAADCVIAATIKTIGSGMINPDKVGLIGHSFGGYETAFIITQTGLFATAVASGAIIDLNSFYLTVGWNTGRPDMWRFEREQWQMGKTPYEDPQAYQRNSPIAWADKINTPVLLWTGKNDRQVDWHQSIEGYLALRRLRKKNIMLLYPEEGHVILNPVNQQDLFKRVQQWFGYYLKDELPPLWISEGIK